MSGLDTRGRPLKKRDESWSFNIAAVSKCSRAPPQS
jgi:hypothetical protein